MAKPAWLRRSILSSDKIKRTREILNRYSLNTICESARCPNLCECFNRGVVTFIIMGSTCTRKCRFCAVKNGVPDAIDSNEPLRIYEAVKQLKLKYIVITSVTRDDLLDGGASHYANAIKYLHKRLDDIKIEVLTPDFNGSYSSLKTIYEAKIDVFAHNIDTVRRLHKSVKPDSDYKTSLETLKMAKRLSKDIPTKSGLLLGLGEIEGEVFQTMAELRDANCDIITLGQYLKSAPDKLEEREFVSPKIFEKYKEMAYNLKFKNVSSGPFVRSSYHLVHLKI
ncbi:MAG: lipoyl synthase [Omnitrophica WOR_2 bacterium SM23_29]|nr:MAG: lipoyl synthase [Omnitrophica WOR_2 bacterium SM23_29]